MAIRSTIVFVNLLVLLMIGSAAAEIYSCRDADGRLHVSDNLQALPDDCRPEAKKLSDTGTDTLNVVPYDAGSSSPDFRFEQLLREQHQLQQERQDAAERLTRKAEELLTSYKQARQDRRTALRRWSYDSRQIIQEADEQIATVRTEKQQLLAELDEWRLSAETENLIRRTLDEIEAAD